MMLDWLRKTQVIHSEIPCILHSKRFLIRQHRFVLFQENSVEGSFAKVVCKFSAVSETGAELSLDKSDTVQIMQTGAQCTYNVRKYVADTCTYQEGWIPAYVIGLRGPDNTQSRYLLLSCRLVTHLQSCFQSQVQCSVSPL